MKKISVRLFFTVLWRGLCQALGWFFGLFGYKGDGKFAKCVWGLFATSVTVILAVFAVVLVTSIGETIYDKYYKEAHCYDPDCNYSEYISKNVYFHNLDDGKGYVFNSLTGWAFSSSNEANFFSSRILRNSRSVTVCPYKSEP